MGSFVIVQTSLGFEHLPTLVAGEFTLKTKTGKYGIVGAPGTVPISPVDPYPDLYWIWIQNPDPDPGGHK